MAISGDRVRASAGLPDDAAGVLAAARAERRAADLAEVRLLELAVQWVLLHPADSIDHPSGEGEAASWFVGGTDTEIAVAGPGAPAMAEFAVAEFATSVGLAPEPGKRLLGEAVELAYRLPRLWGLVRAGRVASWKARRVAAATLALSREGAGFVDRQVTYGGHAAKVGPAAVDRLVAEAIGRYMPDELERLAAASWGVSDLLCKWLVLSRGSRWTLCQKRTLVLSV
jgi:hypothetical protein